MRLFSFAGLGTFNMVLTCVALIPSILFVLFTLPHVQPTTWAEAWRVPSLPPHTHPRPAASTTAPCLRTAALSTATTTGTSTVVCARSPCTGAPCSPTRCGSGMTSSLLPHRSRAQVRVLQHWHAGRRGGQPQENVSAGACHPHPDCVFANGAAAGAVHLHRHQPRQLRARQLLAHCCNRDWALAGTPHHRRRHRLSGAQ